MVQRQVGHPRPYSLGKTVLLCLCLSLLVLRGCSLIARHTIAQAASLREAIKAGQINGFAPTTLVGYRWPREVHPGEFSEVETLNVAVDVNNPDGWPEEWSVVLGKRRADNVWQVIRVARRVRPNVWQDILRHSGKKSSQP